MRRALLILLAVLVLAPLAAVLAARWYLDGDGLRVRAAEAVRRATGRELTIAGPVRLAWSLTPTIEARDVSLANPPGMSRPAMARLDRVEAQVALLPLLSRRVEVRRVVLVGPDVLLERDAAGHPNWLFTPPAPPVPSGTTAPVAGPRMELVVGAVEVEGARLGFRGGAAATEVMIPHLEYAPGTGGVAGQARVNAVPLTLAGTAGPVSGAVWPVDLTLAGGGVTATVGGTTAQAALKVAVPDLAAASGLAGRALPSVRDLQLTAELSAAGLTGLRLQAGAADFGGGVRLTRLSGSAPTVDQPVKLAAEAIAGSLPVALAVNANSLSALLGRGPILLQVLAAANGATLSGAGSVADLRGNGLDVALSARVPDLAGLGALAGLPLPAVRDAALEARLVSAPGGLSVRGLRLAMLQGDLAGDVTVGLSPRPFLRGSLVSQRLDFDAWAAGSAVVPAPAQAAGPGGPAPAVADRLIPDRKLPFAALGRADADVRLTVGEAVWRGASYRSLDARLLLQDGRLRLDPAGLQAPGGAVRAQVLAAAEPPGLSVAVQAPGLAAGPVLALLGAPSGANGAGSGTLDVDLQLRGQGETLRALAATLDGHLGLAMVDGELENRWIADLLGEALRAANLPIEPGGRSHVRCFALRADAANGRVRLRALSLDTTKLKLDGEGGLNLADETLDLHLRPQLRVGTVVALPLHVGGTLRAPKAALDPGALAPGRVGVIIGGPASPDTCGPALAMAREGRAGAAPAPAAPESGRALRPADLLRSLLR